MACQILCLGEPLVEFNQIEGTEWRQGFGGDVSNAAVAAARQGARSGVATRLGDDGFGRLLREMWEAEGVDAGAVETDPDAPTGLYFVRHGPEGHEFEYRRAGSAASRLAPGTLPRAAVEAADILHLSGITQAISESARAASVAAMEAARAVGTRISYDPNLRLALWPLPRARAIIREALRLCDIALPGHEDAAKIFGTRDPEALVDHCLEGGCAIVAMTLGAQGAIIATPHARRRIPAFPVTARDATGAGDAFDAAFLVHLGETGDPFAAGHYACIAAALSTTGYGAIAPLPGRGAVDAARAALSADGDG